MNKNKLELKDYLFISLICVLFGVFYLLAVYAGGALSATLAPMGLGMLGYEPFYGIWFMAPVFTLYFIRKPGIGIITEIIAAVIEVLLGNMFGIIVVVSAFIQGLALDWKLVAAIFVIRLVSALIFTGYLSKLLCDQMVKTGVVKVRG